MSFQRSMSENLQPGQLNAFSANLQFENELAESIRKNSQIMMQEQPKYPATRVLNSINLLCNDSHSIIDHRGGLVESSAVDDETTTLNEYVSSVINSGLVDSSIMPSPLNHPIDDIGFPHEDILRSAQLLLPSSSSSRDFNVCDHALVSAQDTNLVDSNDFAMKLSSVPIHMKPPSLFSSPDDLREQMIIRVEPDTENLNQRVYIHNNDEVSCKVQMKDVRLRTESYVRRKINRASSASEARNLSERRRRDRINEKIHALQRLVPNSRKADKASMLDQVIEYIKALQFQIQIMGRIQQSCAAADVPPFPFPSYYGPHHDRIHNIKMNYSFLRTLLNNNKNNNNNNNNNNNDDNNNNNSRPTNM